MRFSGIIFICVVIFLHEASCVSFQRALYNTMSKKTGGAEKIKRQSDEEEVCIESELVGKDSACILAALDELDVDNPTDEQRQTFVNTVGVVICERDCGRAFIGAYEACGIFEYPAFEDYIIGICASDANGKECYRSLVDADNLYNDVEEDCYTTYERNGMCTCKAALEEAVSDFGCCLNVYHDYDVALDITVYDTASELYTKACNVTLPKDCSTSPLDPDYSAATSVIVSALTMVAALVFTAILQ